MVEMGVTKEKLAKMVTRHPQLLHYSVEDGICPRVDYLRSIGLSREDILKVFARLTQVCNTLMMLSVAFSFLRSSCRIQSTLAV
jgi:hypothetical protein